MPALRAILHATFVLTLFVGARPLAAATAEEDFAVAASHYAASRWELAADEFRFFQQRHAQHPRAAEAEFLRAEALVQLGRLAEACGHYEQFLLHHDQHKLSARALFRWGECCYRTGNRPDALRLLRQFCTAQKNHELNAYALPYLGQLLAASAGDNTPEAEQVLQRALRRFPQGGLADECHLQLAILYYRQQRYEACRSHVDALLRQFPGSPRRTQAVYWRGAACLAAKILRQAPTPSNRWPNPRPPKNSASLRCFFAPNVIDDREWKAKRRSSISLSWKATFRRRGKANR